MTLRRSGAPCGATGAVASLAGHIVVASVLGAPAAILISLIMVPDPQRARTGAKRGGPP